MLTHTGYRARGKRIPAPGRTAPIYGHGGEEIIWAAGVAEEDGGPSTSFGWRLTALRMTIYCLGRNLTTTVGASTGPAN